jgi:type I restriction enzyme S subunit
LFSEDSNYIPLIRIRDVKPAKASTYYSGEILEEYIVTKGDILVGMDGEFNLGKWNDRNGLLNQRVLKLTGKTGICLDGYLFHYMGPVFKKIEKQTAGGSVKHLSAKVINAIQIPVPSISEQSRIVGILDTFSASIENLKQQIAQRRKQYEHYRDQLLDLEGKEGVEMKTLPNISKNCDRERKPITSSKRVSGTFPYYGASGVVDYVDGYIFDGDYLLVSEDGANLLARTTPIAFSIKGQNWVNNHAHVLKFDNHVTQRFVEIYFNMISLEPWINGAAQPKLNQDNLNKIEIPVPSLAEQQRIVSILDTFEASIANLEAQLKEREKQYEYYRNKLLTFE